MQFQKRINKCQMEKKSIKPNAIKKVNKMELSKIHLKCNHARVFCVQSRENIMGVRAGVG